MSFEPIRYLIAFHAKPNAGREVREILESLVPEILMEEECMGAAIWQDGTDPDRYLLVEHWASRAAHDEFVRALEEAGAMDGLADVLRSPAETQHFVQIT